MIPVYLKEAASPDPVDPLYYLVAANGTFLVRKMPLFTASSSVDEMAGLDRHREDVVFHFPKVPRSIIERIIGFFALVYRRWEGEAIAFLFYSPDRREFKVDVPPQTLPRFRSGKRWRTAGKVEYRCLSRPEGFLKLGDVHSHGASPAFFSSTDDRDDEEDGLRIVIGRLDRPTLDVCASFVVNGRRFKLDPEEVLEVPPPRFSTVQPPGEWVRRVVCRYEATQA
jgi:PRTRC genetic system protein A